MALLLVLCAAAAVPHAAATATEAAAAGTALVATPAVDQTAALAAEAGLALLPETTEPRAQQIAALEFAPSIDEDAKHADPPQPEASLRLPGRAHASPSADAGAGSSDGAAPLLYVLSAPANAARRACRLSTLAAKRQVDVVLRSRRGSNYPVELKASQPAAASTA